MIRDTSVLKKTAELIGSRLKEWNLVSEDFKITAARKRAKTNAFNEYFIMHENCEIQLCYCQNIDALFTEIGHPHIPDEWRLFIDSSTSSLKVVLLHIGNIYPSVPIAYSTSMRETYENMKIILDAINYNQHKWKVCCDLKVVALLTGVKQGYSRHQCFLCVWEGRKKDLHYTDFEWETRLNFVIGEFSIDHIPLVKPDDVILPALHIKLGLIRSFIRTLNKESVSFKMLKQIFPKLSDAKIEAGKLFEELFYDLICNNYIFIGVFNGPQTKKLLNSTDFKNALSPVENRAWIAFENVTENFLGNKRANNYKDIVKEMIDGYQEMGVNMSLKIHFLHNHLDFFPSNLGSFSDEHGERFHQEIADIECRYKGKQIRHMLSEYCWLLCRETNTDSYKRQNKRPKFPNT